MVTLELFHKLVDLNCEDLMLELVLRLALNQRRGLSPVFVEPLEEVYQFRDSFCTIMLWPIIVFVVREFPSFQGCTYS